MNVKDNLVPVASLWSVACQFIEGISVFEFRGHLPTEEPGWQAIAPVDGLSRLEQGIQLTGGGAVLTVTVLAANLVRVRFSPTGAFLLRRSWAVTKADETWASPEFDLQESADLVTLNTGEIQCKIERSSGRIEFVDGKGKIFAADVESGIAWHTVPQTGLDTSVVTQVANWKQIDPDEQFYGFGERTGLLNRRHQKMTNWTWDCFNHTVLTDEMYQAIPFFLSLRPGLGYGIFFNTTFRSSIDAGSVNPDLLCLQTDAPELDYYLVYGPSPDRILQTYTELTGRSPLPPHWALGYHQCRWSYASADEVRQIAKEFRDRQLPCDVIHLDIDYMRGFRVFTWNPQQFPEPEQLASDLAEQGFKLIPIIDPGVKFDPDSGYSVFDQGIEKDYFIRKPDGKLFHGYVWPDRALFPDFMNPEVRQWWGDRHADLLDCGIAGIWNDMNEPALDDRPFGDGGIKISIPLEAPQGSDGEPTTHAETHNLYGLMMAQATRTALERLRPQERPFLLTRSGYAGIQRWSAVWTGDNQSRWEYLEMSLPMLCNLGLSGVPFVGADIGGFAGDATPELFARWMQLGVFYPFMRGHSMIGSRPHEPWQFGDRVEAICRDYLNLRYQLLPYLYTLLWQANQSGAPVLRPLLYHYPDDPHTYDLGDQAMFGEALLIAPVCHPGVTHRAVYLPEGTWYDWWTGAVYTGPSHILAPAPLSRIPLFQKAGTAIPLSPVMQHVDQVPLTELHWRVAPGNGESVLYEDDGKSLAYQKGVYSITTILISQSEAQVDVSLSRTGQWTPLPRQVTVEVVGLGEQTVEDDGSDRHLHWA
jgi:alpha-glucosidase